MKFLICLFLLSVSIFELQAKDSSKKSKNQVPAFVDVKEEIKDQKPCDTNANELMKKLEEEQKKKATSSQAFNLQGNNSTGCSIDK